MSRNSAVSSSSSRDTPAYASLAEPASATDAADRDAEKDDDAAALRTPEAEAEAVVIA
jgi:hypothetical protein